MIPARNGITYRQMLEGAAGFFYGAELVTTRGITAPGAPDHLVALGEALADDPHIGWLSVTDNPGGNPMLPADWLGRILKRRSVQVVVHLTCKDLNRNGLESAAWRYAAEGFDNILALTGDYPAPGVGGAPKPVFDLDSASLIALLTMMNQGLEIPSRKGGVDKLPPTRFFVGCGVSPFKRHERELMPQYFKLARKIRCGAQWVIPQLGYDMRKAHDLLLFMRWAGLTVPVVGNVYVLNRVVAGLFNKNKIPGCVVSDALNEKVQKYAGGADKGRAFFDELAAKQLAVFKGLGYAAGYLAGLSKAESFTRIIDLAESYAPDDWKDFAKEIQFGQPDEFYLFEQDSATGLGAAGLLNPEYRRSLAEPPKTASVTLGYQLSRKVHDAAFTPGHALFNAGKRFYDKLDDNGVMSRALHVVEKVSKNLTYNCRDCGDCSLPECAYLCPNASCSKGSRNGPCGGSHDGRCELDDKQCLWARAYDRLKYYGQSQEMLQGPAVFHDASLEGESAWANFYRGRDHNHREETKD